MPSGVLLETATEAEIGRWELLRRAEIVRALQNRVRESGAILPRARLVWSWDEVVEMARNGISFATHSSTYAILTLASAAERPTRFVTDPRYSRRKQARRRFNAIDAYLPQSGASRHSGGGVRHTFAITQ